MTEDKKYNCLVVIIKDRLSELVAKGEVIDRYYNPGDLFRKVHIIVLNDDTIDKANIQRMVGSADLQIHNIPIPSLKIFLILYPFTVLYFKIKWLHLIKVLKPDLIRTHSNSFNGYLAYLSRKYFQIPYIVSMHSVPDYQVYSSLFQKLRRCLLVKIEKTSLKYANCVIAVYKPILRYAREYGAQNIELIYNIVAGDKLKRKNSYYMPRKPRLITVNRQLKGKNPENIIKAIKGIDCYYLIIGNGEYHEYLKKIAREYNLEHKIEFVKAMPNDEICSILNTFDISISHCDYPGISKNTIESALVGLPIIVNNHPQESRLDFEGDWIYVCDNTPNAYKNAILNMINDRGLRERYGKRAYEHALEYFNPAANEHKTVSLYMTVIEKKLQ